ncbi:threonine aldolase family protein [Nocardioides albus]|uniref:Threonine aldolase n=1 Tax=Nocardioides albus TaxID=1841 RepID=A0A7W5F775_9ACTN|nr:aminotransferase class I/II-fold pyridoxal phosphate-dependent enzyme [Nocardioides albus]MBB3087880.1 threonine aldolase [Nocardioides albus]GGU20990.1 threonine aldolase [Nocardioides albus]
MRTHETRRDFASDNCAAAHPKVLAALEAVDGGHLPSYGADLYTSLLEERVRELFGRHARTFPVFNGTGANILGLQAVTPRWSAVVCADAAHLHTDECGAPEYAGFKLLTVPTADGRLDPDDLADLARDARNRHRAQPGVLSLTQSTELGTCYRPAELAVLTEEAHRHGWKVHVDGARLANAAARLGVGLAEAAAGADVISLGVTKNGGMIGEAVVVLDPDADGVGFLQKAGTQLPSKTRYVSAQLLALLDGDLWRANATQANSMADRLAAGLRGAPGVRVVHPVEANAVFASLPAGVAEQLRATYSFSDWGPGTVRLMTAWDTRAEDVDGLLAAVRALMPGDVHDPTARAVQEASSPESVGFLA